MDIETKIMKDLTIYNTYIQLLTPFLFAHFTRHFRFWMFENSFQGDTLTDFHALNQKRNNCNIFLYFIHWKERKSPTMKKLLAFTHSRGPLVVSSSPWPSPEVFVSTQHDRVEDAIVPGSAATTLDDLSIEILLMIFENVLTCFPSSEIIHTNQHLASAKRASPQRYDGIAIYRWAKLRLVCQCWNETLVARVFSSITVTPIHVFASWNLTARLIEVS